MFRKKRKLKSFSSRYSQPYINQFPKAGTSRRLLKKSHPRLNRIKRLSTITTIIAAAIGLVYWFGYSNYFNITEIKIKNDEIENQQIGENVKKIILENLSNNLFLLDTTELENKILELLPEVQDISLEKNYPNTLEISFAQYPLAANLRVQTSTMKKSYLINQLGYPVKEDTENLNLPYITMYSEEPINSEVPAIERAKLKYILTTITYFEEKFGMRIVEVEYKKIAREIHLKTDKDFTIWLDIQKPAEDQLKKLKKSLVKLDIYTEPLQYIDLRIAGEQGDKIIYKRR